MDKGKFAKMPVMRPVNISRSHLPWRKIIGFALALIAIVRLMRYLRVKFSKF